MKRMSRREMAQRIRELEVSQKETVAILLGEVMQVAQEVFEKSDYSVMIRVSQHVEIIEGHVYKGKRDGYSDRLVEFKIHTCEERDGIRHFWGYDPKEKLRSLINNLTYIRDKNKIPYEQLPSRIEENRVYSLT